MRHTYSLVLRKESSIVGMTVFSFLSKIYWFIIKFLSISVSLIIPARSASS